MKKILITGGGCAGMKGTLYSLGLLGMKIKTIGVDMNDDVIGKYLCDKFFTIPKADYPNFLLDVLNLVKREKINVILPQVNEELQKLSLFKRGFECEKTKVAISERKPIDLSINKFRLMNIAKQVGVPCPNCFLVNNISDLEKAVEKLGFPDKPVVIKPPMGRGRMGFRILIAKKQGFLENKPEKFLYLTKEELVWNFPDSFPEMLVTEYLSGKEYSIDVLSDLDKIYIVVPRTRDLIRTGISFAGTVEKNDELIDYAERLTKELKLEYAHGYQFKCDDLGQPKLIECNPRIQGTMVLSTFAGANIIGGALQLALGEKIPEYKVQWGTRLLRNWGSICIKNGKRIFEI